VIEASVSRPVLSIGRRLDAPPQRVFEAWTTPEQLAEWWGPRGFASQVCDLDAWPGGAILLQSRAPDGAFSQTAGAFLDVAAPDRLLFTAGMFEDEDGNPRLEVLYEVHFVGDGGGTEVRLHAVVVQSTPENRPSVAGIEEGWRQSLDRLSEFLAPR
jgi:uncharacterized protein YndB with AHSA1/START domain